MRAGLIQVLAVGDRLGGLGHDAVLVVLDHAGGGLLGGCEIVLIESGRDGCVAFQHVVGVGFVAGGRVVMAFFCHHDRGGETDEAECECVVDFHDLLVRVCSRSMDLPGM